MKKILPKIVIFDLDGTLSLSKQPIDAEMGAFLAKLLENTKVAVISGGKFERFIAQIIEPLSDRKELFENLFIFPTSGGAFYRYEKKDEKWMPVYEMLLTEEQRQKILQAFDRAFAMTKFEQPTVLYGEQMEIRPTQVTYSALGQQAPIEEKSKWDPDMKKRSKVVGVLHELLPEFTISMGGTTSIDVTQKGIDKGYAVMIIEQLLGIPIADMLFVGDKIMPGGNDYTVVPTGVKTQSVIDPEDTKKFLLNLLEE